MSQESTQNSTTQSAPGALLKAAKIQANYSSEQVASRLNLTVELIESIERDDYQESISPAFYRGYLRSYAQLVQIDADELIEMYNEIIHQGSLSVSITPTFDTNLYTKKDRNFPYLKWVLYLFVAAIVLFAGFYVWNKKFDSNNNSQNQISLNDGSTSNSAEIQLSGLNQEETESQSSQADDFVGTEQIQNKVNEDEISASNTSTVIENAILDMNFNGDCWVKVTDANGEVLAIGIKRTGKNMKLEGLAPFSVILGNAGVVTMSYNQQTIDLSGFPAGNRVELKISADSELLQ